MVSSEGQKEQPFDCRRGVVRGYIRGSRRELNPSPCRSGGISEDAAGNGNHTAGGGWKKRHSNQPLKLAVTRTCFSKNRAPDRLLLQSRPNVRAIAKEFNRQIPTGNSVPEERPPTKTLRRRRFGRSSAPIGKKRCNTDGEHITVNLAELLESGNTQNNISCSRRCGHCPPRGHVYALGGGQRPGGSFSKGSTTARTSDPQGGGDAGGMKRIAKRERAVIIRKDSTGKQILHPRRIGQQVGVARSYEKARLKDVSGDQSRTGRPQERGHQEAASFQRHVPRKHLTFNPDGTATKPPLPDSTSARLQKASRPALTPEPRRRITTGPVLQCSPTPTATPSLRPAVPSTHSTKK